MAVQVNSTDSKCLVEKRNGYSRKVPRKVWALIDRVWKRVGILCEAQHEWQLRGRK